MATKQSHSWSLAQTCSDELFEAGLQQVKLLLRNRLHKFPPCPPNAHRTIIHACFVVFTGMHVFHGPYETDVHFFSLCRPYWSSISHRLRYQLCMSLNNGPYTDRLVLWLSIQIFEFSQSSTTWEKYITNITRGCKLLPTLLFICA